MIKAIIFDLWRTTLYSKGSFGKDVIKLLGITLEKEEGLWELLEEHWMKNRFETLEEAAEHTLKAFGIKDNKKIKRFAELYENDKKHIKPYSDAVPAIKKLRKKYKTGLLSNTDCFVLPLLKETGFLKMFDAAVFSCDHGELKPDKNFFRRILTVLEVKPNESIMVGDKMTRDIKPAKALGMHTILIDRHNNYPNIKNKITTLNGLEKIIEKL